MIWVSLVVLLVAAAGIAGAVALARTARRDRDDTLELVPGVPSRAPTSWAGAHNPEARAYRRLVAAVRAGRAAPGTSDGSVGAQRVQIENEAVLIEARLLAAATVPGERRTDAVAEAVALVDGFESLVADFVLAAGESPAALDRAMAESALRLSALREARIEVERIDRLERGIE